MKIASFRREGAHDIGRGTPGRPAVHPLHVCA